MSEAVQAQPRDWREFAESLNLPLLVFVLGSSLYFLLMSAGVLWMDIGELSTSAFQLGGAHPPGHPGHSLLGKLATFLPIGEVATRLSILSALSGGAALAALVALVQVFFPKHGLLAMSAAAIVAMTPALMLNATRGEVYTLTFALLLWGLCLAIRFLRSETPSARDALTGVFLIAIAATIHPAIVLSVGLPLLCTMLWHAQKRCLKLVPYALALTALAAMVYLYLPVRALAIDRPPFVWGDPSSLGRLLDLVSASVYQDNFASSSLHGRIAGRLHMLSEGPAFALVFVGSAGLLFGWITRLRGCGTLLAVVVSIVVASSLQTRFNPDMRAYLGMAHFCLAIGVSVVAMAVARMIAPSLSREDNSPNPRPTSTRIVSVVTMLPVLIMGLLAGPSEGMARDASDDAMQLWDETIAMVPPGPGLFFAEGDHLLFVAQYEELVAGARPDIAVANSELVRDLWFLHHLRTRVPELYMPYLDDGQKGKIAERLYWENVSRGFRVWGDALSPMPKHARAHGFAYEFLASPATSDSLPPTPLRYQGYVGNKIAGLAALRRARFDISQGKLSHAIAGLGAEDAFAAVDTSASIQNPSLVPFLPTLSQVFIYDDSQKQLLIADITWQLGLDRIEGAGGGIEGRIHAAWQMLLTEEYQEAYVLLGTLGDAAMATTPAMLVSLGRLELAERLLRQRIADQNQDDSALALLASLLANKNQPDSRREAISLFERACEIAPDNAETYNRLGLVYIQEGREADAEAAWRRALELAPERQDTRAFLQRLETQRASAQP